MKVNIYATVGRSGQMGLKGLLPFPRINASIINELVKWDVTVVGEKSLDQFKWLKKKPLPFSSFRTAAEMKDQCRRRYYDKNLWILGSATTLREWAPYVNGRVIIEVMDYDGPADVWFPWKAYGLKQKSPVKRDASNDGAPGKAKVG